MSAATSAPELSVVLVVGELRDRARRTLAGLGAQTALDRIELVLIDGAGPEAEEVEVPSGLAVKRISRRGAGLEQRYEGVREAGAPVVAFLEDHAVPEPGWAEALIVAHRDPWGAVGYAFKLPEPSNYFSRAALVSEAGLWMHPARGGHIRCLPSSNVSVRRDLLDAISRESGPFRMDEHVLSGSLDRAGHRMALEPNAVITHEYFGSLWPLLVVNYAHGRLLGGARCHDWSRPRRAVWALGTPLSAPVVRSWRLVGSIRSMRRAGQVVLAAPVLVLSFASAAIGEALGYALGTGDWVSRVDRWELEAARLEAIGEGPTPVPSTAR